MPYITRLFTSTVAWTAVLLFLKVASFGTQKAAAAFPSKRQVLTAAISRSGIAPVADQQSRPTKVKPVPEHIRIDNYENSYQLKADYTYTQILSQRQTLLTLHGIEAGQRAVLDYDPDSQSLTLLEAYVIQPDGQRINVLKDSIYTRPCMFGVISGS